MSAQLSKARARRVAFTLLAAVLLLSGLANALDVPTYLGPKPPAKVRRVVTLGPSLTETVIALGAADRLVRVSRFYEFPQASALPRVGGLLDPRVGAVIALKQRLVH